MLYIMMLIGFIISSWAATKPLTINRQLEDEKTKMNNALKIIGFPIVSMLFATLLVFSFGYWPVISYLYLILIPILIGSVSLFFSKKR